MIVLDRVSRAFREGGHSRVVLDGFSGSVASGERLALVGRSGVGKSTLLNLIGGMDRPDAGCVTVAGTELTSLSERDRTLFRRYHIGFVFQFFNLIPTLTVEENLLLPLELAGRTTDADRARARDLLGRVGLADRGRAWPDRLSGGEQQRVAVARALVHEPDLVLADEPTGNLDQGTGNDVLDLLESMVRNSGTTLLMVTHSETDATRADRILDLVSGAVVERAPRTPTPRSG